MACTITRQPRSRLLVACTGCSWTFLTPFGPVALRAADLHSAHAHPRHTA